MKARESVWKCVKVRESAWNQLQDHHHCVGLEKSWKMMYDTWGPKIIPGESVKVCESAWNQLQDHRHRDGLEKSWKMMYCKWGQVEKSGKGKKSTYELGGLLVFLLKKLLNLPTAVTFKGSEMSAIAPRRKLLVSSRRSFWYPSWPLASFFYPWRHTH